MPKKRDACWTLYGYLPTRDLTDPIHGPNTPEPVEPEYTPPEGRIYEITVGRTDPSGNNTGPWKLVQTLRATSPTSAYHLAREQHPELSGLPLRVDGPAGFHESATGEIRRAS